MQDLSAFFQPLTTAPYNLLEADRPETLGGVADVHTGSHIPDWYEADVVLLGWPFDEGAADSPGAALGPDAIRERLYTLALPGGDLKVADLGNFKARDSQEQAIESLAYVLEQLARAGKMAVILGGTQELALAQYLAFEPLEMPVQAVAVDSRADLNFSRSGLANDNYAYYLFSHSPAYLRHYTLLGLQNYFLTDAERNLLKTLHFDFVRIAELRTDLRMAEPAFRMADFVTLDIGALRMSDAPGRAQGSPAGFTIEEACMLSRFAARGYKLQSFSVTEVNPELDHNGQTAAAAALIVWHFLEGYLTRIHDTPAADRSNLQTFRVTLQGGHVKELTFYYSATSERWWMEVRPMLGSKGNTFPPELVPCTELDYLQASSGELPERWIAWQQRLLPTRR